jgi:hypothetical protein
VGTEWLSPKDFDFHALFQRALQAAITSGDGFVHTEISQLSVVLKPLKLRICLANSALACIIASGLFFCSQQAKNRGPRCFWQVCSTSSQKDNRKIGFYIT